MAVGDVNNDGLEDFYVGGARGFQGNFIFQTNDGFIAPVTSPGRRY